jgi:RNA polymerase sigma-70 factor (ECF subfamily)
MDAEWLEERFEQERPRLLAVAFRLLGSRYDAEDAVQEAWLRLNRADTRGVDNLSGWLTTVVARIALDLLRKRGVRAAASLDEVPPGEQAAQAVDPSVDVEVVDAVGSALSVVLDQLSPAERLAFVLHDVFGLQFDELGVILDRTPNATKQLASRARNKLRGVDPSSRQDRHAQRQVVDAFLAAARQGDFDRLIALLHPDVALDPDAAAIRMGAPSPTRGATAVAKVFEGRALAARAALVGGSIGIAWMANDRPRVVWDVVVDDRKIVHIDMHADPDAIAALEVTPL